MTAWRMAQGVGMVILLLVIPAAMAQAPDLSKMDIVLKSVPDGPVARVGETYLGAEEFKDLYLSEVTRIQALSPGETLADIDRIEVAMRCLRILIERSILLQEANKRSLKVPDAELQEEWKQQIARFGKGLSQDESKPLTEEQVLKIAQTSREEALDDLRETMLIEKMRDKIMEERGVKVTDAEVEAFYKENKGEEETADQVRILQIHIRPKTSTPSAKPDQAALNKAREEAERALARIKSGEKFEAVARAVSDGPLKDAGGDPGRPVPVSYLPETIREKVLALKPGSITDAMQTDTGFHIVKLLEIIPGKPQTLEDIAPKIQALLMARKSNDAIREFCSEREGSFQVYLDFDKQIAHRPDLQQILQDLEPSKETPKK